MFSIIIPTFNNLDYLKLCINSIKKNSAFQHEIIVHINEGIDGTLQYLENQKIKTTFSKVNAGVCVAFNQAANVASKKYLVLAHDDMYFCPEWDTVFFNEIKNYPKNDDFFISGTMVQPFASYLQFDCGKTIKDFNEKKLLDGVNKIQFDNFQGTHWQPSLIPKTTWDKVNGFSEEFSPGLGSDPDFNMKLWNIGVRIFKGLGKCRVYHFSSISLRKKAWNNGAKTFLLKWGMSIKFFKKYYLKSDSPFKGPLTEPDKNLMFYLDLVKCKITYFFHLIISKSNA
jgi:glycosyltransferase involved in cell wall biosynthesis|tara:strand:+ start:242 stop:1093 length:852 start_codon:yes stop_codon:yes gene_type:complete